MSCVDDFIQSTRSFLKDYCDQLGWKLARDSKSDATRQDLNSSVTLVSEGKKRKCNETYDQELFPPAFSDESEKSKRLVIEALQNTVDGIDGNLVSAAPKSSSDLLIAFNPSQRLALYDHAVQQTKDHVLTLPLTELDLAFGGYADCGDQINKEKSRHEVLSEERDHKRRRVSYKQLKKVHTQNKSHTEVIAEVISNQMEMYHEWLRACDVQKSEINTTGHEKDEMARHAECSSRKRHRDRSRSRSPHHKHSKKRRERSVKEHRVGERGEKRHGKHKKHKKDKK